MLGAGMNYSRKSLFEVGDLVVDKDDGRLARVIYLYQQPQIAREVIAVLFFGDDVPLAVPYDSIVLVRAAP
jgi:hypothetical protein